MRAILIATGDCAEDSLLAHDLTGPLLPIVDKPMIQHVVESLVNQGFKQIDVVVSHLAHEIEATLGDGGRWGIRICFHLARDARHPYRSLLSLHPPIGESPVLLGHTDRLPQFEELVPPAAAPLLYVEPNDVRYDAWTGWAWISADDLACVDEQLDRGGLEQILRAGNRDTGLMIADGGLDARSFKQLLESNQSVLSGNVPGLSPGGREVDPGIWLSRNVSLHPTARLIAPVFIAEDCRIGEGAQVGPATIVGPGCVLDRRCTLSQTLLFPSSYVGQGIELSDAIVVRNHLVDLRNGTELCFDDDLLLSSVRAPSLAELARSVGGRLIGIVGLLLSSPLLVILALGLKLIKRGKVLVSSEAVQLPASSDVHRWRTYRLWRFNASAEGTRWEGLADLFFRFLPGLFNVARGEIRLVGVPARSPSEIESLPGDWRHLYLQARAGLVTESTLVPARSIWSQDQRVSEAYHTVAGGIVYDLRLLLHYLRRASLGGFTQQSEKSTTAHASARTTTVPLAQNGVGSQSAGMLEKVTV